MNEMKTEDGFKVKVGQQGKDYVIDLGDDPFVMSAADWEKFLDLVGKTGGQK